MRLILILASLIKLSISFKILVYSTQVSFSHVSFMGHIADTLVTAGHDVLVYLPAYADGVNATGVKLARTIVSPRNFKIQVDRDAYLGQNWKKDQAKPGQLFKSAKVMAQVQAQLCRSQLENLEMLEKLKSEKFDLGIGKLYDPCSFAYFEAINLTKYIATSSTCMIDALLEPFGFESSPSYIPATLGHFTDEMSYKERAKNFLMWLVTKAVHRFVLKPPLNSLLLEKFGADFDLSATIAKSAYIFVNSEEFLEFPRTISHKVVYIGGIGVKKPKPLEEKFAKIMDDAVNGAVFISFGSNLKSSTMPEEMKMAFVQTFQRFPKIMFIWKYETDDDVGKGQANLVKVKWAPQNDLLGHGNLKAFISHGGANSVLECAYAGLPLVAIPVFSDQMRNAKMAAKRGIAIVLDKRNITEALLSEALLEIMNNARYHESAKRLQALLAKKPFNAAQRVIKYSEFAAKFAPFENLDLASANLNFFQYYLLDIILPLIFMLTLCFLLSVRLLVFTCRKLFLHQKAKKE